MSTGSSNSSLTTLSEDLLLIEERRNCLLTVSAFEGDAMSDGDIEFEEGDEAGGSEPLGYVLDVAYKTPELWNHHNGRVSLIRARPA